jgi:hypothetical protein
VDSIVDLETTEIQTVQTEAGRDVQVGKIGDHLALLLNLDEIVSENLGDKAQALAQQAA